MAVLTLPNTFRKTLSRDYLSLFAMSALLPDMKQENDEMICPHTKTEELDHPYLPAMIICLACRKTINGSWVGNTTIQEFENYEGGF